MSDYFKQLKSYLAKSLNEEPAPLEGAAALKAGLPADPGAGAGIVPTDSPIDYLAGSLGNKLGSKLAQDSASILGNEIGSLGTNIKAPIMENDAPGIIQKFQQRLGKGPLSTQDMSSAAQQLQDAAAQKGVSSGVTANLMQALQERANRELMQQQAKQNAQKVVGENLINKLRAAQK